MLSPQHALLFGAPHDGCSIGGEKATGATVMVCRVLLSANLFAGMTVSQSEVKREMVLAALLVGQEDGEGKPSEPALTLVNFRYGTVEKVPPPPPPPPPPSQEAVRVALACDRDEWTCACHNDKNRDGTSLRRHAWARRGRYRRVPEQSPVCAAAPARADSGTIEVVVHLVNIPCCLCPGVPPDPPSYGAVSQRQLAGAA